MFDFSSNTKVEKHKPKRSPLEAPAQQQQQADVAGQTKAYGSANATDANFSGPTQDTPYYKSLVASSTDATSDAYESAKANSAAKAQQAGFGYDSPIGQAASRETTNTEAAKLGQIPAQAAAVTAPLQLEAAGQQLQEGTALGQQSLGYENAAVNLEDEFQKRNSAFQNKLWDIGAGAAGGALGVPV